MPSIVEPPLPCNYMLQLFFLKQSNGATCVVKHVVLGERQRVGLVRNCLRGSGRITDRGGHEKAGAKALYWLFYRLPGTHFCLTTVDGYSVLSEKELLSEQHIEYGVDDINHCPNIQQRQCSTQVDYEGAQ